MEKNYTIVNKDEKYHVIKIGNKRATKVFDSYDAASAFVSSFSCKETAPKMTETSTINTQTEIITAPSARKPFYQRLLDALTSLK